MKLSTRRLRLRPPLLADVPADYACASREDVSRPAGFPRHENLAQTRRRIRAGIREWKKRHPQKMPFSILLKTNGAWIGNVTLSWPHAGVGAIGYNLHPDHWGRGCATEAARRIRDLAFARFGAHRVEATCWVKNARSARVLRKLGLRKEGRLRGYLKRGDVVRDEVIWGITRADWLKKRRRL